MDCTQVRAGLLLAASARTGSWVRGWSCRVRPLFRCSFKCDMDAECQLPSTAAEASDHLSSCSLTADLAGHLLRQNTVSHALKGDEALTWSGDMTMTCNRTMQALRDNNVPRVDHGIEVLYRFAAFDPFQRSHYFGCADTSRWREFCR
jgi:hypothetical protein